MTKQNRKRSNGLVRPIRTKRDYKGASAVIERLSGQKTRDSAAELRLQSLLQEMDKFDEPEDDADTGSPQDYDYSGPRRRWSDDGSSSADA